MPSWTLGSQVMGSAIQFYRITDPNSPPYSGEGFSEKGIDSNYATPYHPQANGQVELFNKTQVKQLRYCVSDHVATWSRYFRLVVPAYNSQVHCGTGQVSFAFVSPRRLTPVAIERHTAGTDTGEAVTPGREN